MKKLIIGFVVILLLAGGWQIKHVNAEKEFERKAACLYLSGGPKEIVEKHIEITEKMADTSPYPDYLPVHLYHRVTENTPWGFRGTGTLLSKYPTYIVTAYHVLSGTYGQWGYRIISNRELSGTDPILPIIDYKDPGADDTLTCVTDPKATVFPTLSVPFKEFTGIDRSRTYKALTFPHKIRFLTSRERTFQGLFWMELDPGRWHVYFKGSVRPGESGTGAIIDEGQPGVLLVIIEKSGLDQPDLGLKGDEELAVGHLIQIH